MACYRLTFQNDKVFEVVAESDAVADGLQTTLCTAIIYRVINDVREHKPIQRMSGGPIQITAPSADAAVEIARNVLTDVTGSTVERVSECGTRSVLPPLPDSA